MLQTLTVSIVAVLLLIVKKLLEDKLSPRWQYGVWSILILRIILPAAQSYKNMFSIPLWIEILKTRAEMLMNSAFSMVYEPVTVRHFLPIVKGVPISITDWLFVIYGAGVLFFLVKYLVTYLKLQKILKGSREASESILEKVQGVCEKYNLKACRVVEVPGITSAFICGGIPSVLAVPVGVNLDEKILLHELLHLKYHDTLQNIGWCILRSLHWCNPFLHYVFNRVGNDMESLCDQRVLERLEGEERREYGVILLNMANERYARMPGTSSISNGGKNISRRIAAIVRFKKYPKGMALVSVCIVLVLASSILFERNHTYGSEAFHPKSLRELETAMAMTRINRCTTIAGAIDTYAKGLIYDNGIFLATASSLEKQKAFYEQMQESVEDGWASYHLRSGEELECVEEWSGYYIINMRKISEDVYSAILSFDVESFPKMDSEMSDSVIMAEDGSAQSGCVQIPIEIRQENGWTIEEIGMRKFVPKDSLWAMDELDPLNTLRAVGETGTFEVDLRTRHHVRKDNENINGYYSGSKLSEAPVLDAEFDYGYVEYRSEYSLEGKTVEAEPMTYVGTMFKSVDSADEKVEFPDERVAGNITGSSSAGFEWSAEEITEGWEGVHVNGGGESCELQADETVKLPRYCKVQIYWDGDLVEELLAKEVVP